MSRLLKREGEESRSCSLSVCRILHHERAMGHKFCVHANFTGSSRHSHALFHCIHARVQASGWYGQEERREKKKERKAIRGMAQKSLDPANWTAQLLDGTDSKSVSFIHLANARFYRLLAITREDRVSISLCSLRHTPTATFNPPVSFYAV